MIDIKILRDNPELVKANAKRRGCDVDIDALAAMDKEYLQLVRQVEDLRAERNRLSKECQKNPEARETVKQMKVELGEKEKLRAELIRCGCDPEEENEFGISYRLLRENDPQNIH